LTASESQRALPVAQRHREQWHLTNLMNGRSTSNSTNPQGHPPRAIMPHSPWLLAVAYLMENGSILFKCPSESPAQRYAAFGSKGRKNDRS
jgi:hypothetical protein